MSDIRQITSWRSSTATAGLYEDLLASIGDDGFGACVRDSVAALIGNARRLYLFEATSRDDTSLQYYFGEPHLPDLFPAYRKWYLPLDPVCEAYSAAPSFSDLALQRVRPAHIASTGFRRRIFEDAGIVERVSLIQRGPEAWRVMSVARHESDGCFSDREVSALIDLGCLVLPMLSQNRKRRMALAPLTVAQLEERFSLRFPSLTARERQVCARAASGLSVEATALELGVAKTSILTYRQRAYQRLDVSSPLELRALVTH